jgi:APA family basic amino acid/polyamine antiporter
VSLTPQPQLVRAIGRWTLAALVINGIIGSGIFGLPNQVGKLLGTAAPFAYLLAAAGIGLIMACFAEVASQFDRSGGPYLYARETFGRFVGAQMGWFAWLVRVTSAAANTSLFVIYLGEFWPPATQPLPRAVLLTVVLGFLTVVNVRGVKGGATVSNIFVIAKLVPLTLFIVAGFALLGGQIPAPASDAGTGTWLAALLLLVFAYGGFEAAMMPMAEVRDPRRAAPFALFVALAVCATFYTLIHVVVMTALPDPGASERPLADAARAFLGTAGAGFIAFGALVSTFGNVSAQFVMAPRLMFAFAEQRDFPALFAAVHSRFRTPYVSIIVHAVLVWALAIYGSFVWNAVLSAVARLITYGIVCAAMIQLRRSRPTADAFRLPAGWLFAAGGFGFCVLMVLQMSYEHLVILGVVTAVAAVNWLLARGQKGAAQ